MDQGVLVGVALDVALLAEGVDRNIRAGMKPTDIAVALLAEGVDRNLMLVRVLLIRWSRPPRGGRG